MKRSIELTTLIELREAVFAELEQIQEEGYVIGMTVDERRVWVESKDHIMNRIIDLDKDIKKQQIIDDRKQKEKENEDRFRE